MNQEALGREAPASRKKFIADAISAVKELEARRLSRSPDQLAESAWHKLQFDLPAVDTEELQALVQKFRVSLQGKISWPCYPITQKALENITAQAARAATFAPALSMEERQLQQLLTESLSTSVTKAASAAKSKARHDSSHATNDHHHQQQQPQHQHQQQQQSGQQVAAQKELYQQLCAVVLLQYVTKLLTVPEQVAWQLLAQYDPAAGNTAPDTRLKQQQASLQGQQQCEGLNQQQQQQAQHVDKYRTPVDAPASAFEQHRDVGLSSAASPSCAVYEVQEAAEQDHDSEEYDDIGPGPASNSLQCIQLQDRGQQLSPKLQQQLQQVSLQCQQQQQVQEQYSWPALQAKLVSFADSVHYKLLSCESVWRDHAAAQHLLQVLRSLGVHSHADQLQPLLHAYVTLLLDRISVASSDIPLLLQLWEALGLNEANQISIDYGLQRSRAYHGVSRQTSLPVEAVLGLSVAAHLWQQLTGHSLRSKLWRLMYDNLLPLLESCSEQLAYNTAAARNTPKSSSSSGSSSGANGASNQDKHSDGFAHVLLVSFIVELMVLGRPSDVDVAKQLTQLGILRNLVQLFLQHGSNFAAEPLRRALLLTSWSSAHAASWVLAVPDVQQQLQQQCYQLGGAVEAHGALWQLLASRLAQPAVKAVSAGSSSNGSKVVCGQCMSLLELQTDDVQQLRRQLVLLQLLVDVQKTMSREPRWEDWLLGKLRQLVPSLQLAEDNPSGANGSTTAPSQVMRKAALAAAASTKTGGATAPSSSKGHDDTVSSSSSSRKQLSNDDNQKSYVHDIAVAQKQLRQLQPTALRLIKELLTQGGKND